MMEQEELKRRILEVLPELRERGISHMALFGSRARGDARADSDIDLMIDIDKPRFSLLDLVAVERRLREVIGLPVQIATRRSLPADFLSGPTAARIDIF